MIRTYTLSPLRKLAMVLGFCLMLTALEARAEHWQKDFVNAIDKACLSKKQNLLLFTGLEWEQSSKRLKDEILSKPEFSATLAIDFVLTCLDLPPPSELDVESKRDDKGYALAREFRLEVVPSFLLCTPEGRPYASVLYDDRSTDALLDEIRHKRDAFGIAMSGISAMQGVDRARAIHAWIQTLPESLRPLQTEMTHAIIELDANDLTGLRSKYLMADRMPQARQLRYTGDLGLAENLYKEVLKECRLSDEQRQDLYYELADVYFQRRDYDELLNTVEKAMAAAPQGARMPVLNEMIEVFTRRWIYVKYDPEGMKAADYDTTRLKVAHPDETRRLLKLIDEAKISHATSPRFFALKRLETELRKNA